MSQRPMLMGDFTELPPGRNGMDHLNFEFPYDRQNLLTRIKENRDKHVAAYEEAWKGYLIEVGEQLDKAAKDARANAKKIKDWQGDIGKLPEGLVTAFHVNAHAPQSHKDEYDRVIDMLELTNLDNITLNQQEFNQYVRDEWAWSRQFNETAGAYSAKFRSSNAL